MKIKEGVVSDNLDICEWLRHSSSDEWCAPMLEKAADEIERLQLMERDCHLFVETLLHLPALSEEVRRVASRYVATV